MIKKLVVIFTSFFFINGFSQEKSIHIQLSGNLFNLPSDTFYIARNAGGNNLQDLYTGTVNKKGNFSEKIELPQNDFYILRLTDGQTVNLILRDGDEIKVYGDGNNLFQHTNIVGSKDSQLLNDFLKVNAAYLQKLDSAKLYLKENPGQQKQVNESFQKVYNEFRKNRQQFIAEHKDSPALIATISTFNLEQEFDQYAQVVDLLEQSSGDFPTIQKVVKEKEENLAKIQKANPFRPGAEAQEISMENPEGEVINLSDYKGKVVLVDFWASWCGPCRKENPNVVKLYEKYKEDGFTVFSVSLDKSKDRWINAIKQDNLSWDGHVSDLKGWQNAAAQQYGVSSIPFTVLLDKEGKVISTNLRGFQLEKTLESIFGH